MDPLPTVGSLWLTLTGVRYMYGPPHSLKNIYILPSGVVFTIIDVLHRRGLAKFLSSTGKIGLIDLAWWTNRNYLEELDPPLGTSKSSAGVFTQ